MPYNPAWPLPPIHSLLQQVSPAIAVPETTVWVLRLDLIHPTVSGNKALKLMGWLRLYHRHAYRGIISIGGPWSNHLHALAYTCALYHIPLTMLVKGHAQMDTSMLRDCRQQGATIQFYHHRREEEVLALWQQKAQKDHLLMIPMGGDGPEGCQGVTEYFATLNWSGFGTVWIACGSGTTLTGIYPTLPAFMEVCALLPGFSATPSLSRLVQSDARIELYRDKGRFGHTTPELKQLADSWCRQTGIPLDYCYTARLLDFMQAQMHRKKGPHLFIHTGGLQGNRSFAEKTQEV